MEVGAKWHHVHLGRIVVGHRIGAVVIDHWISSWLVYVDHCARLVVYMSIQFHHLLSVVDAIQVLLP
jgi:hypothetical protein